MQFDVICGAMPAHPASSIGAKILPDDPFFDLVTEAYCVFAGPKPKSTEVFEECCMDRGIAARFFDSPIDYLPLEYVREWFSAATVVGGVSQQLWSYLLPRILEILAAGNEPSFVGLEVSLMRYPTGKSANWTKPQWNVLDKFQRAYLAQAVAGAGDHLDDVICMFSLASWPLNSLLEQVEAQHDAALVERLWRDWCEWNPEFVGEIWLTAFWDKPERARLFEFYTSEALYRRMEALALSDATDSALAVKASAVAEVIEANAEWLTEL